MNIHTHTRTHILLGAEFGNARLFLPRDDVHQSSISRKAELSAGEPSEDRPHSSSSSSSGSSRGELAQPQQGPARKSPSAFSPILLCTPSTV